MDPSQLQTDKDNDANSLEGTGTVVEGEKKASQDTSSTQEVVADARSETSETVSPAAPQSSARPPLFKRVWQKFNIYLLLLLLVMLIAIGFTVGLFLKDRADTKKADSIIGTQDLSEDALKQLANTDVTVGNAKQILKVESNAIFAGSVLVRKDLEVAGTIKVGGELQLPSITVSGNSRFNQVQTETLAVVGATTVQGVFTARRGMNVTGNSSFDGSVSATQISTNTLLLNGDLKLTNHITAGGPMPGISRGNALGSGGTASLSGSDTTGSITLNTGSGPSAGCFATVRFVRKFDGVPHVNITPIGSGAAGIPYYVNRSTTEFSVCTTSPAPAGQSFGFDYIVLN